MKELIPQFVTHAEAVAFRDLAYSAIGALPVTATGFTFLIAARWLILRLATRRNHAVGERERNAAMGLVWGAYLLSVGISMSGVLSHHGQAPEWSSSELVTAFLVVSALLAPGICCAGQPRLRSFSLLRRGIERQNVSATVCLAASTLGNGLILNGVLSSNRHNFTQALPAIFAYWILGQALFQVAGWLHSKTSSYDVQRLIHDEDMLAAGLNFGGLLLSLGIIVRSLSVVGGDASLVWQLFTSSLTSLFGLLLMVCFLRMRSHRLASFRRRPTNAMLASPPEPPIVDAFITVSAALVFCISMQNRLTPEDPVTDSLTAMSFETNIPARSSATSGRLPSAPAGTFSIAVIPDTQSYRGAETPSNPLTNVVFDGYVNWIVNNIPQQRFVFVTHVGDIVEHNKHAHWKLARRIMDRLHGVIPYGISVGNHDMARYGDSSLFQCYFPTSRFEEFDWYVASFRRPFSETSTNWIASLFDSVRQHPLSNARSANNANSCQLFSAEGLEFVILHLECNAPDDVLRWADKMLHKYRSRRAIITTHMYLGRVNQPLVPNAPLAPGEPVGRMIWHKCHIEQGNSAEQMWDKSFRKHANLFLICSGDQSEVQALHQTSVGDHGNVVYSLLSDYGDRGLRVIRFIPVDDRIEVRTWNPLVGRLCITTDAVPDKLQHQFELDYEMSEDIPAGKGGDKPHVQQTQTLRPD